MQNVFFERRQTRNDWKLKIRSNGSLKQYGIRGLRRLKSLSKFPMGAVLKLLGYILHKKKRRRMTTYARDEVDSSWPAVTTDIESNHTL